MAITRSAYRIAAVKQVGGIHLQLQALIFLVDRCEVVSDGSIEEDTRTILEGVLVIAVACADETRAAA